MKPMVFDYVLLEGFPMGKYAYTSVGDVTHTVRQFSAKVTTAVHWMYGQEIEEQEKKAPQN
jgi:molybdopterin-guanine dinucleotide biosynthesis protein